MSTLQTVQDLLGHKDFKMTLRYAHLSPEHRKSAVEILSEKCIMLGNKVKEAKVKKDVKIAESWHKYGTGTKTANLSVLTSY